MQRVRSRSPGCDGRKTLQQWAQDSPFLDVAANEPGRPATTRPPDKVRILYPSFPTSCSPAELESVCAACEHATDATLTVVLGPGQERPPVTAGELKDMGSAALARQSSIRSLGMEASEHDVLRPVRHVSDGDARNASPVHDCGPEPQRGRMRRAERRATGARARELRLQVFKRTDLEVSHKLGSGSFGGVWQARILPTSRRGAAHTVVVKVVWPDADLDR